MLKKTDPVERILLRHKKITEKTLKEVKANNIHSGNYLGKTLADHGYIHTQTLLETLSTELRLPYIKKGQYPKSGLPVEGLTITETFLREKIIFPLQLKDDTLIVAVYDPFDLYTIEDLKVSLGKNIRVVLSSEQDILESIETYYGEEGGSAMNRMVGNIHDDDLHGLDSLDDSTEHIRDMASEAPVIKLVNHIISQAIEARASDIHLEPFEEDLSLRYRIDGILHELEPPPKRLSAAITTRIKIMAKLDISERRLPQDGRIKLKILGKDIDMRVSTLPTLYGESVVMRILDRENLVLDLSQMGFPEKELKQMEKQEYQLRKESQKLSQQFNELSKKNPMIPSELSQGMKQTERHMEQAETNLREQNIRKSIESENLALKGLNETSDLLKQMKDSNGKTKQARRQNPRKLGTGSSPDSRRGGATRMQKERVLLPDETQHKAPKEFREEILNAMKKQTPRDYERMVMEYYKDLVQ